METLIILVYFISAIFLGFIVALGTEVFIGEEKAKKMPGGSLCVGFLMGWQQAIGLWFIVLLSTAGIIGWIIYLLYLRKKE